MTDHTIKAHFIVSPQPSLMTREDRIVAAMASAMGGEEIGASKAARRIFRAVMAMRAAERIEDERERTSLDMQLLTIEDD